VRTHFLLLALGLVLFLASPALAAGSSSGLVFGSFYDEFIGYWKEKFRQQNAMVLGVLLLGAVSILIIMTSKKGRK
jgi:hypothetical protein